LDPSEGQYLPTDPYVRRFWTAVLGPGAMVELLRLSKAARNSAKVREPLHLRGLLESGLARVDEGSILIHERIPAVPARLVQRLPVRLRREHALAVALSATANGPDQGQPEGGSLTRQETQAHSEPRRAPAEQHRRQANRQSTHPGGGQLAG
jgi:hypothetical protein